MAYDDTGSGYGYTSTEGLIRAGAARYGIPAYIPLDIAQVESGLNPGTIGDNGTSFGLFQLHRGGLAPSSLSDSQLLNPATNINIALQSLAPAVKRGQALGYSGVQLVEYSAFTSAWPGNYGSISAGESARPDYAAALQRAYGVGDTAALSQAAAQGADVNGNYSGNEYHSTAAETFRQFSGHEKVEDYKTWYANRSFGEKLNPFSSNPAAYLWDQRSAYGMRVLFVLIGLVFVVVGIIGVVLKGSSEVMQEAAPAEPAGGPAPALQGEAAL